MTHEPAAGPLLRRHLGDRRFLLMLPRAVGLQVLHPAIAPALIEHSSTRLWEHKKRAVLQMIYLACAAHDTAAAIRFAHEHIKGHDDLGHRYHALHPDTFLFQHATYVETLMTAADVFGPALTDETRAELYDQCCRWYRGYGISDRSLPGTWPEFTAYFAEACATRLRLTPAATRLADQVLRPDAWVVRRLPTAAVRAMQHERAVELYGLTPRAGDAAALRAVAVATRAGFTTAPRRLRIVTQAR
ncbi:oxygenase MpaB family protein [Nocardia sp. AG03]|uniref:oxygenase MpaB family protein n=1 Tax=Nocardia sp. AG03 TaxID=3025312 RepID=UPI00241864D0|nr:oxygenase MpaB family protein [Nocardia sp. AG03]